MKFFLDLIVILLGLTVALMFFPALIGIFVGIMKFDSGNIFGGIIAIILGFVFQVLFFLFIFSGSGVSLSKEDEDCPYCGSGDTDGNHCYTCEDDKTEMVYEIT